MVGNLTVSRFPVLNKIHTVGFNGQLGPEYAGNDKEPQKHIFVVKVRPPNSEGGLWSKAILCSLSLAGVFLLPIYHF